MRLIPAALSMGTRVVPPQGIEIEGTFIPGDVKIAAPRYTIFRRKYFKLLCSLVYVLRLERKVKL